MAVTLDPTAQSPTATNVVVFPERVGGRVTNVAGSTVTLTNTRGTDTVLVSPSTKYYEKGASPTGVSNGEVVTVFGLPHAGTPGELDAAGRRHLQPGASPSPSPAAAAARRAAASVRLGAVGTPGSSRPSPNADPRRPGGLVGPGRACGPHVPTGSAGTAGTPGPLSGHSPGGFGVQGFGHR